MELKAVYSVHRRLKQEQCITARIYL